MIDRRPLIIGICGGSASGKSLLALTLADLLLGQAVIISQDWYYHDSSHLDAEALGRRNFDHPDAINLPAFTADLNELRQGQAICPTKYCFASHRSLPGTRLLEPAPVVIAEGLFMFQHEGLRQLFDLRVFVHADSEVRLRRRIQRDGKERGRTPESVTRQYLETVHPMHQRYVEPNRRHAEIILNPANREMLGADAAQLVTTIQAALTPGLAGQPDR